ncbi:MAG: HlyC/CorC family transporter [Phycisphaerales bacterium]|jgi:CBS domain containing-hemolysin-like protein|nr:HlyC/CorC family transporter [Phycisphaerales bacterium]
MMLLMIYLFVALGVSFLCSLLEAALLSMPRSHVMLLAEQGHPAGKRLERMKDNMDRPLSAILTLNTFGHTLGAAGVGAQAAIIWGDAWVGLVGFVVTILILIVSEIIPKTLGVTYAKALAPFVAWTVGGMVMILRPLVAVCDWISKRLSPNSHSKGKISRDEVNSLIKLASQEGAIDPEEANIIRNLIALRDTAVQEIITPRTVVFTLQADQTVSDATQNEPPHFARIPVVGTSLDDTKGFVNRRQLYKMLNDGHGEMTLGEMAQPLHAVPAIAKLPAVLKDFIQRREQMFLVVDEYGGSAGVVTLEDVLETVLGVEIVDESDPADDMQQLAKNLLSGPRYDKL